MRKPGAAKRERRREGSPFRRGLCLTITPPPKKKDSPILPSQHTFFISPSPSGTNHLATTLMGLVVTLFFPPSLPSSRLLSFLSQVHP